MTIVKIPLAGPPALSIADITTGSTVRGGTWRAHQDLINYLTAKGGQLVLCNAPGTVITAGGSHTFRYYAWPRAIHTRRVWLIDMTSVGARSEISVQDGATTAGTFFTGANAPTSQPWNATANLADSYVYVGEYTATSTPGEITLVVSATTVDAAVYRLSCFELPRTTLELGAGDDASTFAGPGYAIYADDEVGVYGIAQAVEAGRTNHRRANFHWYNATGFTTTSGSFVPVFALPPKVVGRAGSSADGTTIDVEWAARVVTTGGDAEIRVTAASGDSDTITANGAAAWYTGTITIDREDLSDADTGGQGARPLGDALTFEARITTASTMTVTGLADSEAL